MTFSEWMMGVDEQLLSIVGMVSDDLADQPWRDWFDDEYTSREAAMEALQNEGYDA